MYLNKAAKKKKQKTVKGLREDPRGGVEGKAAREGRREANAPNQREII